MEAVEIINAKFISTNSIIPEKLHMTYKKKDREKSLDKKR